MRNTAWAAWRPWSRFPAAAGPGERLLQRFRVSTPQAQCAPLSGLTRMIPRAVSAHTKS
jgi:hypothetical protein